ncbi:MAG: TetR family transcriptional regulator [Nocardia sp.]|uniref:TetR/AcrR family transcriptional regulator n=1 Tax=Nocardia sp. TaxID=1821 RepID=UPI00261BABA8|nr:TetR/AcrR family transcriptional regulator [Nocardia sp.]MCU1644970.1 TetR family transcriptional regulator [Nocardia sp.]
MSNPAPQEGTTPASPGRPRQAYVEAAVLNAARARLARDGYARTTIGAIAADAGVTRPTVYRRWASKADLITAAIADITTTPEPPASGDSRADLLTELRALYASLAARDTLGLIGAVLAEEQHNPDLLALFRTRLLEPRLVRIRSVLEAGIAHGTLLPDLDLEAVCDMLAGSFLAAHLNTGSLPADLPERLTRTLWPALKSVNVSID